MDLRPHITFYGDLNIAEKYQKKLSEGLPLEATEWQRSYGRGSRFVKIRPSCLQFEPWMAISEPQNNARLGLHQIPILHIFWMVDTDVSVYKSHGKAAVVDWLKPLQESQCHNWMVVIVGDVDSSRFDFSKKTGKSGNVVDRVKQDFCSKQPNRCFHLRVNDKQSLLECESWQGLLQRIRHFSVQALTRFMTRCEDFVRDVRERCHQKDWHYAEYFLLQEQLAFLLEMWGCLKESLVQYDELDAMFSQFVINTHSGAIPGWLDDFCQASVVCEGLPLLEASVSKYRQLLRDRCMTLLDLRNYVFSRQAQLLCRTDRGVEIAQRTLPFFYNTLRELDVLQVNNMGGLVESWVYMSCFEVIRLLERLSDHHSGDNMFQSSLSLHRANLWHYALQKLYRLAELCGLAQNSSATVNVPSLIASCVSGNQSEGSSARSQLCQALCSQVDFAKHFIHLSELTRSAFSREGRQRQSLLVSIHLVKFYISQCDYSSAESLLVQACSSYNSDSWSTLLVTNLVLLADCWHKLNLPKKYIQAYTVLSSSAAPLPTETQQSYFQKLMAFSQEVNKEDSDEDAIVILGTPLVRLSGVEVSGEEVLWMEDLSLQVQLDSLAPQEFVCRRVSVCLLARRGLRLLTCRRSSSYHNCQSRISQDITSSVVEVSLHPDGTEEDEKPQLVREKSARLHRPVSSVLSAHNLPNMGIDWLLDEDSSSLNDNNRQSLAKTIVLSLDNVLLKPGLNTLSFSGKALHCGDFVVHDVLLDVGCVTLCFRWKRDTSLYALTSQHLKVLPGQPAFSVSGLLAGSDRWLFAGVKEQLGLQITNGIAERTSVILQEKDDMELCFEGGELTAQVTDSDGLSEPIVLAVHPITDSGFILELPALPPQQTVTVPLTVRFKSSCILEKHGKKEPTTVELPVIVDQIDLEHTETIEVLLCQPLLLSPRVHEARGRVFLQLCVVSCCNCPLWLRASAPEAKAGISTTPLHKVDSFKVTPDQEVSFVWELEAAGGWQSNVKCVVLFCPSAEETEAPPAETMLSSSCELNVQHAQSAH